jgi:phage-related protein
MLDPESGIPSVYHVISEQLMMMQQIAVVRLGLAPDPMTHMPAKNLREARVAIEVLTKLVQEMMPVLQPEEVGQIGQLVRELRARYTDAVAQETGQS